MFVEVIVCNISVIFRDTVYNVLSVILNQFYTVCLSVSVSLMHVALYAASFTYSWKTRMLLPAIKCGSELSRKDQTV